MVAIAASKASVRPAATRRLRRNAAFVASSISTCAGTSAATRSSAPRGAGAPVVAATTEGAVTFARSAELTTICANAAVERSRMRPSTASPAGEPVTTAPSCTP